MELLREAFRLYRSSLRQTAPVVLWTLLAAWVFGSLVAYALTRLAPIPFGTPHALAGTAAALACVLCLSPVGAAVTARCAAARWIGEGMPDAPPPPGIRWLRLAGTALILSIPTLVFVYGFPIGAAALIFSFWWMFAPHAAFIEGEGGRTALRRSRAIAHGQFNAAALPGAVSLFAAAAALMAIQAVRPIAPPSGFTEQVGGEYLYRLAEGERYEPEGRFLIRGEEAVPYPRGTEYDAEARVLKLAAPEPAPALTALLWTGLPTLAAAALEPFRWWTHCLLYFQMRLRGEGLTRDALFWEMDDAEDGFPTDVSA